MVTFDLKRLLCLIKYSGTVQNCIAVVCQMNNLENKNVPKLLLAI